MTSVSFISTGLLLIFAESIFAPAFCQLKDRSKLKETPQSQWELAFHDRNLTHQNKPVTITGRSRFSRQILGTDDFDLRNTDRCVRHVHQEAPNPVYHRFQSQPMLNINVGEDSSKCIEIFEDNDCTGRRMSIQFHNVAKKTLLLNKFDPRDPSRDKLLNFNLAPNSIKKCTPTEDLDVSSFLTWKVAFCRSQLQIIFDSSLPATFKLSDNCLDLNKNSVPPTDQISLSVKKGLWEDNICLELYTGSNCGGQMVRLMVPADGATTRSKPFLIWRNFDNASGRIIIDTDVSSVRKCGPCLNPYRRLKEPNLADDNDDDATITIYADERNNKECKFFNCTNVMDMLSLTNLAEWDKDVGDEPCYFFFNNSQCATRPSARQEEKINLTLMEQIISAFPEFSGWSMAECISHGEIPEQCLTPLYAGQTLLDLFPLGNGDESTPTGEEETILSATENIIIYVAVGSLLLLLVLLALWMLRFRIKKVFENRRQPLHRITTLSMRSRQIQSYQISRDAFVIDGESCLGSGAFGKVCRGKIKSESGEGMEEVAVKMVKETCPEIGLNGLLYEIKILTNLKEHPNIVKLKGTYAENNEIFVFLELCELGSLKDYLRNIEPPVARNSIGQTYYVDMETGDKILSGVDNGGLGEIIASDIVRWSVEIANGLEFLTKQRIVHMDIATRNVLLSSEKRAKITDFGLSRRLYDYQSYLKKQQEPLPWRWMAPESLRRLEFTEKSDVWAFGVTLWEIFTLGDEPYPGLAWDVNFSAKLENGLRLGEPKYNIDGVYSVMCRCWDVNPVKRPAFSELGKLLVPKSMLTSMPQ